jgi:MFS transporter, DHA1 family, multidrug resistance protein
MIFAVSPAIAPIAGALLCGIGGWRAVFLATGIFAAVLLLVANLTLPESLAVEHRYPINLASLLRTYYRVSLDKQFMHLSMSNALNFGALFLYVSSTPRFILDFLHLSSSDFSWLFLPGVAGISTGAGVASRCSGGFTDSAVLRAGFGIMLAAGLVNAGMKEVLHNPMLPWLSVRLRSWRSGLRLVSHFLPCSAQNGFPSNEELHLECRLPCH